MEDKMYNKKRKIIDLRVGDVFYYNGYTYNINRIVSSEDGNVIVHYGDAYSKESIKLNPTTLVELKTT